MVIGTYRITYIAEVVERFGLQLEDLETIQVASVDPEPYESFPSRLDYDMTFATAISDCLADRGIAAPVIQAAEGPGVDVGINALRDPDFTRAHGLCVVEALLMYPPRPEPTSVDEWRVVYDEQVTTAKCLEDNFQYPSHKPTFDAYLDNPSGWSAYDAVTDGSQDQWRSVNETCPQP